MSAGDRRHILYRFFDADDILLYVGITCNPPNRLGKHALEKDWWHDVARMTCEHFPDRKSVLAAEREAIQTEKPRHNVRLTGDNVKAGEAWSEPSITGLVGRFFHTWSDPEEVGEHAIVIRGKALRWQGHVVDQIDENNYLVQLFSWWDGCPTDTQLATLGEMRTWTFYDSSVEMQVALPCGEYFARDRYTCQNPRTHYVRRDGMAVSFHCWNCIDFYGGDKGELKYPNGKPVLP